MTSTLIVRHEGAVTCLTLNRESCGNLVSMQMISELSSAICSIPQSTKLLLLSGKGADFCKGRDYSEAPEAAGVHRAKPSGLDIRKNMTEPIIELYGQLRNLRVPSLSIVSGVARGFGCALACACDIVVCGESARFSLPEMTERGLPPSLAMTALWNRSSLRALTYMVYSTAEIDAQAAWQYGLASAVVPDERLLEHAQTLAATISRQPIDSIKAVKEYLKRAPETSEPARASLGETLFSLVAASS